MSVTESDVFPQLRRAKFAVPAAPESAGLARRLTEAVMRFWTSAVDEDATLLMLSELFTNALVHGVDRKAARSAMISVEVLETSCGLHVEVHVPDQGGRKVAVTRATPEEMNEFGHGLEMVESMSSAWGCKDTPEGKYVYFDVLTPEFGQVQDLPGAAMPTASDAVLRTVACAESR